MSIWTAETELNPANTLHHSFLRKKPPCFAPMLPFCFSYYLLFFWLGNRRDCLVSRTGRLLWVNHCFLSIFKLLCLGDFLRAKLGQMPMQGKTYIIIYVIYIIICNVYNLSISFVLSGVPDCLRHQPSTLYSLFVFLSDIPVIKHEFKIPFTCLQ